MVSVAHLGYGYWGKNIARNFAEIGALQAVIDPHQPNAAAATAALGVPAAPLEAVLADPTIDGISIASPAEMHFSHTHAALSAGKHVFVEKPLALKMSDAEQLCALARKQGLVLMVGHLLQYHPVYLKLRDMVRTGELGRILYVYSNRMSLGKFRTEENVLWSFAPHDISMILGLTDEAPTHVSAQGNVSFTRGIADMVTVQMHFPSGASGHVQVSWMHPFKEQRLTVIGEDAMVVFEDSEPAWNAKLKLYRHNIQKDAHVPSVKKAEAELIPTVQSEPLRNECQHFLDCITSGKEPLTNGAEGLRVLRVLSQAEHALQQNIQLQAESFVR